MERTILAGVAASQLFNAITAYTISTSASAQQARDVMFWLLGSFSGVRWPEFQLVIVVVLAGPRSACGMPGRWMHSPSAMMPPPRWGLPLHMPDPLHHRGADHRHHRQYGRLDRLCRPGGAARDALLLWPAVKTKGSPSSSGSPAPRLRPMPMLAAKTAPPDLSPACWADIMR